MKLNILYCFLIVIGCYSCAATKSEKIEDVTLQIHPNYVPASSLVMPSNIIQLKDDGPQSIIGEIDKIIYWGEDVYIFDDTHDMISCFDSEGQLKASTKKYIGHGKNEYVHLVDVSFDEVDSLLYVLCDTPSEIMVFDKGLNVVSVHSLSLMPLEMCVNSNQILLFSVNHDKGVYEIHTLDKHHLNESPNLLLTSEILVDRIMGLGKNVLSTQGECWIALPFNNCLYKIEDGKIGETYRVLFEDKWFVKRGGKARDFLEENTDKVWTIQNMQRMGALLWFNSNTEDIYCLDIHKGVCHCYSAMVHDAIPFATQLMIPQQGKKDCISFRVFPEFINSYVKKMEKHHLEGKEHDLYVAAKKYQKEKNAMIIDWKTSTP